MSSAGRAESASNTPPKNIQKKSTLELYTTSGVI